jgi:ADP-ribose pyrophosphatase YjhB (NUDIX family)
MTAQHLRVAAYGVCLQDERVLLARYVSPDGAVRHWTLPGGRVEHGEDPYDAVVREMAEETGYQVRVEQLLGVDSRTRRVEWDGGAVFQAIGIFYRVRITGGRLRNEVGGSTDLAVWIPVSDVPELERAVIIDVGLQLHRTRPPTGHVPPIPVDGLLRH